MEKMTVRQVSEAIGYEQETIRKKVKELFPEIVVNGIQTELNEEQVFKLKNALVPRTSAMKSGVDNAVTDLEMKEKTLQVISWLKVEVEKEKRARIEAEAKNAILMHVSKVYTATEIAKELDMRSAQELNQKLEDMGIQYKVNDTWVLTAEYAGSGYFDIKQNVLDSGKVVYDRKITQLGRDFIVNLFTKSEAK